jgi:hypothetical protein
MHSTLEQVDLLKLLTQILQDIILLIHLFIYLMLSIKIQKNNSIFKGNRRFPFEPSLTTKIFEKECPKNCDNLENYFLCSHFDFFPDYHIFLDILFLSLLPEKFPKTKYFILIYDRRIHY